MITYPVGSSTSSTVRPVVLLMSFLSQLQYNTMTVARRQLNLEDSQARRVTDVLPQPTTIQHNDSSP